MTLVRFQESPDGLECWVNFRYDPEIVGLIKSWIDHRDRTYDAPSKTWTIPASQAISLRSLLSERGHEIEEVVPRPRKSETLETLFGDGYDVDDKAAELLDQIPVEHQGKVFRAMAKILYPDMYQVRR